MGKRRETIEYDYKLVDQYNKIRESEKGPYAYKHIKKKKIVNRENNYELWLELQAMNCIYVIYHEEIESNDELKSGLFSRNKHGFEMPLEDYNNIADKCDKILDGDETVYIEILEEMEDLCQENNLNKKDKDRVKELYPYLYAYVLFLNADDVEEKELDNIITRFKKAMDNQGQDELVVQSSKTSIPEDEFIQEIHPVEDDEPIISNQEENEEEPVIKNVVEDEVEEKTTDTKIIFDTDYFNYRNGKYEGQEDGDYVYSNKLTGELICRENDNNLWLELQAMNFINKLYKKEIKNVKEKNSELEADEEIIFFTVPEKEIVVAHKLYENKVDEDDLREYLRELCIVNEIKENEVEKIYELYPFFCAYTWVKKYDISATKALVELKNIPRLHSQEGELEISEEKQEDLIVRFDNTYYNYKVAIMEDNSIVYCDENNGSYVSEENRTTSWIKLQAMNYMSKLYKLDESDEEFVLPEDQYIDILTAYIDNGSITYENVRNICESRDLTEAETDKVCELYPYFCGYVIGEKNRLSTEEVMSIVKQIKDMLNGEESSFENIEKTMVLNVPKNNEIIDKFLNRLNKQAE